jgi:pimeloyl-ACP methyl ester carboxylesterase
VSDLIQKELQMECTLENITVHYEVYGKGQPLIILPGWGNSAVLSAAWWEPIFQQRQGFKRIYIDPPGHGRTPGRDWITNQDKMLDIVIECIDKLTERKMFVLAGHSLGAYLARGVIYHRAHLIDGLFMAVPVIAAEDSRRIVPQHTILIDNPVGVAELTPAEAEIAGMAVVRNKSTLDRVRAIVGQDDGGIENSKFLEKIREAPEKYAFSFDVDSLAVPFLKPTLIISGRQDSVAGYKDAWKILDNYPRAAYILFDRAGHLLEDKDALISVLVAEWLDRVQESKGFK